MNEFQKLASDLVAAALRIADAAERVADNCEQLVGAVSGERQVVDINKAGMTSWNLVPHYVRPHYVLLPFAGSDDERKADA